MSVAGYVIGGGLLLSGGALMESKDTGKTTEFDEGRTAYRQAFGAMLFLGGAAVLITAVARTHTHRDPAAPEVRAGRAVLTVCPYAPIAGATVTVTADGISRRGVTDASGNVTLEVPSTLTNGVVEIDGKPVQLVRTP